MLNNIVNNIEQSGQQNIVHSCFQQPATAHIIHGRVVYVSCQKNGI